MQKILTIDDSPDIQRLLEARLRPEGVELLPALTAEEGLRKAIELQPDLILLDVDLPGTNGFDLCVRLKADPRTSEIPIIFLSGASEVQAKVKGFDLGAVDYVTKPFEPTELRARVRAALRTKRFQDLLSVRAQVDGLTGAFNRRYLDRRLSEEVSRCARYGSTFTLALADLDHFKKLNDTHGHPFGDRVLQSFADILMASVRATDFVCRYGGEEFTIVLPETGAESSRVVLDRIALRLRDLRLESKGAKIPVTASWGLADAAEIPKDLLTSALIIERADAALYSAKHAGRNCARVWSPALAK